MLIRWKYRFIAWFFDKPDALSRRVEVESKLLSHFKAGTQPTPQECMKMATKLGVPTWAQKRPNDKAVRQAAATLGENDDA